MIDELFNSNILKSNNTLTYGKYWVYFFRIKKYRRS